MWFIPLSVGGGDGGGVDEAPSPPSPGSNNSHWGNTCIDLRGAFYRQRRHLYTGAVLLFSP